LEYENHGKSRRNIPQDPFVEATETAQDPAENLSSKTAANFEWTTLRWFKLFGLIFVFMLFYIYNSLHATKAIKRKEELKKQLKELHSEQISLESDINKESKQTQIAERLKNSGLKELTQPPIKLIRDTKTDK
jgi:Bacteriodetes cell division protein (FtsL-like)